jgi:hypothetical protein
LAASSETAKNWPSPDAALECVGIVAWMVNARHVKAVPGRKTDVDDAQWLATLARAGLLRDSFIAKADLRRLRHIAGLSSAKAGEPQGMRYRTL